MLQSCSSLMSGPTGALEAKPKSKNCLNGNLVDGRGLVVFQIE